MKYDCPICKEEHESAKLYGIDFLPCPRIPENLLVPYDALKLSAFSEFRATELATKTAIPSFVLKAGKLKPSQ